MQLSNLKCLTVETQSVSVLCGRMQITASPSLRDDVIGSRR